MEYFNTHLKPFIDRLYDDGLLFEALINKEQSSILYFKDEVKRFNHKYLIEASKNWKANDDVHLDKG